ncbi:Uncharacterized protein FWK35_00035034, partial [Aphis craccivora]
NTTYIIFYRFPNRDYEKETKDEKWIKAINRIIENGKPWRPSVHSVVCSAHFINNKRSLDPRSPSYIPSIFPKVYKKKTTNVLQNIARYERSINRQNQSTEFKQINNEIIPSTELELNNITTINISTQVAFEVSEESFIFYCVYEGNNNVGTQASVNLNLNFTKPKSAEKSCGVDSSNTSSYITGVTFTIFNFLLSLLPQTNRTIISTEDTLLIMLMKVKLGLTYSALGTFFSVHRTTISRVFSECLLILSHRTNNLIFWPSKTTIVDTLPEVFKKHYPHCRCIIDCTEVKVEQPPTVQQRVCMYSRYKGGYTIKVLVAITPNGMVSFLSKAYGGRSSDSFITNDSGFLNKLEPGDQVLADKGFPGIKPGVEGQNSILVMPPMLHNGRFSEEEVIQT